MKKLLAVIISLSIWSTVALGAYDCPTGDGESGLKNDSVTDNTVALNACLAAGELESDKTVNIPASGGPSTDYRFESDIVIPDGVIINCADNAYFEAIGDFILSDYSRVVNCNFDSHARAITTPDDDPKTKVTGAQIRDCTFEGSSSHAVILLYHCDDCIVDNNVITDSGDNFQNIQIISGTGNIITNNIVDGGKTCIILKWTETANTATKGVFDTIIMDNTCSNLSEEGISVDMGAGATTTFPSREADQVVSVSSNVVTLGNSGWDDGTQDYSDYYMVVVTDNDSGEGIEGQYRKITSHSGDDFTLESAITGLEVNDWVSITAIAENIYIAFNALSGAGYVQSNILLYGAVFYSRIEENSSKGIAIRSLDEGYIADDSETGNGARSPASFNLVRDNDVNVPPPGEDCETSAVNCDVEAIYNDLGQTAQYTPYKTYGNVFVDNTIGDELQMTYQDYFKSGNTYDDFTSSNSTDAGSTALDVTSFTCVEYGLRCVSAGSAIALVSDLNSTCSGDSVCAGYGDDVSPPITGMTIN